MTRIRLIAGLLALGLLGGARAATAIDASFPATTVTVLAAASLTEGFGAMRTAFEQSHPGMHVELSFAGSPMLVQQIQQGAPADVFASADEANMQKLVDGGQVADHAAVFARNALAIVVGKGNPKGIARLADLARPGLVVVLCGPTVPAGRYAIEAFGKAGVPVPAGSQETDVKAVVAKVALGEADAGVVYTTDVRAAGERVAGVDIPAEHNVVARYPIAVLKDAPSKAAAYAFVAFVLAPDGQHVLERFGFRAP